MAAKLTYVTKQTMQIANAIAFVCDRPNDEP